MDKKKLKEHFVVLPDCNGCNGGITTNTSSGYQVTSVRLYPFLLSHYSKEFINNICLIKIDAETHDSVILFDLDPKFRPPVIWVEWHRSYKFYDYENLILEDDNLCTPESANLFNISHHLGYQVFQPRHPLQRVEGCQNKYYEFDLLLLENRFVNKYVPHL